MTPQGLPSGAQPRSPSWLSGKHVRHSAQLREQISNTNNETPWTKVWCSSSSSGVTKPPKSCWDLKQGRDPWKARNLLSTLQMKKRRLRWKHGVCEAVGLSPMRQWRRCLPGTWPVLWPLPCMLLLSPRRRCRTKTRDSCLHWGTFTASWRSSAQRVSTGRMPGQVAGPPPSELEQALKAGAANPFPPGAWPTSFQG